MSKWKYKVKHIKVPFLSKAVDKAAFIEEKLTRLGMEGWELVVMDRREHEYNVTLYLKRPY